MLPPTLGDVAGAAAAAASNCREPGLDRVDCCACRSGVGGLMVVADGFPGHFL